MKQTSDILVIFFSEKITTVLLIGIWKKQVIAFLHVLEFLTENPLMNTRHRLLDMSKSSKTCRSESGWTLNFWRKQSKLNVQSLSTYHNLGKFGIEFALFWHRLRKLLKTELHSFWMVNAIANFRVIWTRPEATYTTTLSRHFYKASVIFSQQPWVYTATQPFGVRTNRGLNETKRPKDFSRFAEWPKQQSSRESIQSEARDRVLELSFGGGGEGW